MLQMHNVPACWPGGVSSCWLAYCSPSLLQSVHSLLFWGANSIRSSLLRCLILSFCISFVLFLFPLSFSISFVLFYFLCPLSSATGMSVDTRKLWPQPLVMAADTLKLWPQPLPMAAGTCKLCPQSFDCCGHTKALSAAIGDGCGHMKALSAAIGDGCGQK